MSKSTFVDQLPTNLPMNKNTENDEELLIREALDELVEQKQNLEEYNSEEMEMEMEMEKRYNSNKAVDSREDLIIEETIETKKPIHLMKPLISELQTTMYVVVIFFIVSTIPIEKMIYKYISLNKIPYSDIILKAILAGAIFFVITKL
jgi:hypothetical protein